MLAFPEGDVKNVSKLRKMLALAYEAVKKVLASSEMAWHSQRELLKSVGKFRNVLAFAEGDVKKVFASLEES